MRTLAIDLNDRLRRAQLPVPPELEMRYSDLLPMPDLAPALAEAEALLTNPRVPIDDEFLALAPGLRFVQLSSAGFERVNIDSTVRHGVAVANSGVAIAPAVAEHVFMVSMVLLRQLFRCHQGIQNDRYVEVKNQLMEEGLGELAGRTLGIIGLGRIGREVARRAIPFGLNTIYYDIVRPSPAQEEALHVTFTPMAELLQRADILTVHVPLDDSTYHLVGAAELEQLRPSAIVINAARGPLVDPAPLAAMVEEGRIAAAAVDVFETEPSPDTDNDPLVRLAATGCERLVLTPHMAGVTAEAQRRALTHSLANLARVARGEPPIDIVNGVAVRPAGVPAT